MKSYLKKAVLLTVVVIVTACAPAAEQPGAGVEETATAEADLAAINNVLNKEVAAINAGDIEGLMAITTDDIVLMPSNEPARVGKEACRSWSQDFFAQFSAQYAASSEEVVVAGDWAFQRYSDTITLTPVAGGEPMELQSKGIHIYQRQPDGSWKVARDIWNSNEPPAAME